MAKKKAEFPPVLVVSGSQELLRLRFLRGMKATQAAAGWDVEDVDGRNASAIADAKPLGIAVGAVKLAITAFVVPFAFMYGEGLLLEGPITGIILNCLTAALGVIVLSAGIEGYWKAPLSGIAQAMLLVAGLMFLAPSIIALGIAVALVVAAVISTPHLRSRAKIA